MEAGESGRKEELWGGWFAMGPDRLRIGQDGKSVMKMVKGRTMRWSKVSSFTHERTSKGWEREV